MNEFEMRPMIEDEDKYAYKNSTQICGQTGCIGYLRADMDTDGNGFFSTWYDIRGYLKTDEFKTEFDNVINSLRIDGGALHNRSDMAKYCNHTPQAKMSGEENCYGLRIDSEKYTYLMRLNPNKGEYNLYCFCYRRDWLEQHINNAKRGIRFIDTNYNTLFKIDDGDKIKITYTITNKEDIIPCRYIDEYHLEVGNNLYHICEFAERMEKKNCIVEKV